MKQSGFTLLELLLTIGISAIVAGIAVGTYTGVFRELELESARTQLISDLREVRARAVSVEDGKKWGIHFINSTDDYYEIFSTPTNYADGSKVVATTVYLAGGITFVDPAESITDDIIFNKHTGATTANSITIKNAWDSNKTISVNSSGNIE